VTMHLSSTVMEIWPFEVLPGRLFQEQRSVVSRSVGPQYYTDLIQSGPKNRTCLSIDNSTMVRGRKTCNTSKVSECCTE